MTLPLSSKVGRPDNPRTNLTTNFIFLDSSLFLLPLTSPCSAVTAALDIEMLPFTLEEAVHAPQECSTQVSPEHCELDLSRHLLRHPC